MFSVSLPELLQGAALDNRNVSANMLRTKFYVCPVCGNLVHATGELLVSCHGVTLTPETAEPCDDRHEVALSKVEDDWFVEIRHEMTKTHYISFIAAVSADRIQLVKLYPEGSAECRFPRRGVRKIYFYCNRDGLFEVTAK